MSVVAVVQSMPSELQISMLAFAEALEEKIHTEIAVRREDFAELSAKVDRLAAVQQQTVDQVNRLEAAVARLAEAQMRTEAQMERLAEAQRLADQRIAELAEAQRRTEAQVQLLTEAQRRTEERMDRLEQAMAELAEAQRRTEAQVQLLTEAQRRTEERMDRLEQAMAALAEAQRRTEERVDRLEQAMAELAEAQRRTEAQVQLLIEAQRRTEETVRYHSKRLDGLIGDNLERKYRERAFSFFGPILSPVRSVPLEEALPGLEDRLSEKEYADLLLLDVLLHGRARGVEGRPEVWIALEVSAKVDRNDVERAVRRAQLLAKAGLPAVPAVAGEAITEGASNLAAQRAALVLQNGRRLNWPEALQAALARSTGSSEDLH
ncbi:MAG: hypothetical protein RMN53_14325 [Anaerolineae bacterium]|nr:hypothetical protein [Anaerolineae bacterium]